MLRLLQSGLSQDPTSAAEAWRPADRSDPFFEPGQASRLADPDRPFVTTRLWRGRTNSPLPSVRRAPLVFPPPFVPRNIHPKKKKAAARSCRHAHTPARRPAFVVSTARADPDDPPQLSAPRSPWICLRAATGDGGAGAAPAARGSSSSLPLPRRAAPRPQQNHLKSGQGGIRLCGGCFFASLRFASRNWSTFRTLVLILVFEFFFLTPRTERRL